MLTEENAQIWLLYATLYSAYLTEQFCSFMLYALEYDPNDRYVLDEKFDQVWEELQQTLSDYLMAHFNNRPHTLDDGMLIDNCTASILMVAMSMNKPRKENIVKDMLKVICQRL